MRLFFSLAVACALVPGLSACGGGDSAEFLSAAAGSPAVLKTTDTVVGSGLEATTGSRVQVNYTGWLYDAGAADFKGTRFSASSPGKPFIFVIGAVDSGESAIPGLSQGVQGMKAGGKRTIVIPSRLAYGDQGVPGLIPANSGLVFEVELVKVCGTAAC